MFWLRNRKIIFCYTLNNKRSVLCLSNDAFSKSSLYSMPSPLFTEIDYKANLKNTLVSPYPTLFYRYGSVGRKIIFLTSQIIYPLNLIVYSKICLKRPLNKIQKNVCFIKTDYRIMQVKSIAECSQGAFCNTFDLHLTLISLNNLCCVYL